MHSTIPKDKDYNLNLEAYHFFFVSNPPQIAPIKPLTKYLQNNKQPNWPANKTKPNSM